MPHGEAAARPDLQFERDLARRGELPIAGIDEVGRGALAGPLFAAAVILPIQRFDLASALQAVRDSKALSATARARCAASIRLIALDWAIGWAEAEEVDAVGPLVATRLAMQRALESLSLRPRHALIDHLALPDVALAQSPIDQGDSRSLSIAAASVLAKVARDGVMDALAHQYPTYGFSEHKGYGTEAHLRALRRWGPSPVHRRSFEPVAVLL
ncbi:MAG TPA: ribonuclease HII [Anaerolineales bacterium]|nr:ribonuclease HII [Anaerolineales bacterium]